MEESYQRSAPHEPLPANPEAAAAMAGEEVDGSAPGAYLLTVLCHTEEASQGTELVVESGRRSWAFIACAVPGALAEASGAYARVVLRPALQSCPGGGQYCLNATATWTQQRADFELVTEVPTSWHFGRTLARYLEGPLSELAPALRLAPASRVAHVSHIFAELDSGTRRYVTIDNLAAAVSHCRFLWLLAFFPP